MQEVGELIYLILKELEASCPWITHSIEQVYSSSRRFLHTRKGA